MRSAGTAYALVVEGLGVGRVIARPFVGEPGRFVRTANRHDFACPPLGETLLDRLSASNVPVTAIGKIGDLFAGQGVLRSRPTASDDEGMDAIEAALESEPQGLIFANLVDFDTRVRPSQRRARDTPGTSNASTRDCPSCCRDCAPADLLVVTADHGNDPTTPSTDHSREYVPLLVLGAGARAGVDLGERASFADLAQTLAEVFGVGRLRSRNEFLRPALRHASRRQLVARSPASP